MNDSFSHLDDQGRARMVDVTDKDSTSRTAHARAMVRMAPRTLAMIMDQEHPKGDVLAVARLAGIQAAKNLGPDPLCHPLMLSGVEVQLEPDGDDALRVDARCKLKGRTGVEMEALTAASVAALTVYDMCKAVDRAMEIEHIHLVEKTGGRSGEFRREAP